VALKGYSEDGKIFIEYPNSVQNTIPYAYTESQDYPKKKLLDFTFGGVKEILEREQ